MDIYQAIDAAIKAPPKTRVEASTFLSAYPPDVQAQLIAAIYLGRDHIHSETLLDEYDWTRRATDHIPADEYSRILYEKAGAITTYLERLLVCAKASGYDLKNM